MRKKGSGYGTNGPDAAPAPLGVVVLMVLRMVGKALECTLLLGGELQEQLPYLAQYLIVAAFGFALLTLIADLLERRAGPKE